MTEQHVTAASALVRDLTTRFTEPDWLRAERERAWDTFESMPSPRLEKSDLTNRPWEIGPFPTVVSAAQSHDAVELLRQGEERAMVHVQDGVVLRVNCPDELKSKGVIFTDLHTAIRDHGDLVQKYLGSVVQQDENKWSALNAAVWHGGVFLYVPRHVEVEEAFHFVYVETAEGRGAVPRVLVVGDEGSRFDYIDVHVVSGERERGTVHSSVVEVVAKANAQIKAVSLTQLTTGPTNFVVRRAKVENDALVEWVFGDVGDGYSVGLVESHLAGTGSRSTSKVIGIGYGRQHFDLTANMKHIGRHSESDIVMHSALRERANSLYRSCTHIIMGASGSGSEQTDRMIMLDGTARADAIPMLLIDEHDVKRCGHAASVGKIDPLQIFYMQSRGISKEVATKMIVWGYLQPTVEEIPSEAVRDLVVRQIERKLV